MIRPAYLTAVKDDSDIIYKNLEYYHNIGINDFFIMLHCSDPETVDQIMKFEADKKINLFLLQDNDYVFKQDLHFKQLSAAAWEKGFNWHIATDSDELLILRKHKTIQEFLKEYPGNDSLTFRWYNYSMHKTADSGNIFIDRKYREIPHLDWSKSIAQWSADTKMYWVVGQHVLVNSLSNVMVDPSIAYYAHFPYRSFEQWKTRFADWAITKKKRFSEPCWHEEYEQLQTPDFIENKWDNLKWKYEENWNNPEIFVFDPIYPDLFL